MAIEKRVFLIILVASISISIIGSYFIFNEFSGIEEKRLDIINNYVIYQIVNVASSSGWTKEFNIELCNFSSTGNNTYFILEIGWQLILEGIEGGDNVKVNITVLNKTEMVNGIETRVVQEYETVNDEVIEISLNYFAICEQTNSVFYFGENVSNFSGGEIVSHSGSWRADEGDNKPGLIMPGVILLGARYYQEIAPGVAMDRAEIMKNNETVTTPAGTFEKCLVVRESSPLEPFIYQNKYHAPDIGYIIDVNLELTQYGFI